MRLEADNNDLNRTPRSLYDSGIGDSGLFAAEPQQILEIIESSERIRAFDFARKKFALVFEITSDLGKEVRARNLRIAGSILLPLVVACGSGDSTSDGSGHAGQTNPLPVSTGEAVMVVPTPGVFEQESGDFDGPIAFSYEEGTDIKDIHYIEEGVELAENYFADVLDAELGGDYIVTTVRFSDDPAVTVSGEGVLINTTHSDWISVGPMEKRAIIVGSIFRLLQAEMTSGSTNDLPWWVSEGAVEYAVRMALVHDELMSADGVREEAIKSANRQISLSRDVEDGSLDDQSTLATAFLAWEHLVGDREPSLVADFFEVVSRNQVGGWEEGFEEVFGTTVEDFYKSFDVYARQGFSTTVANGSSGESGSEPSRPAEVFSFGEGVSAEDEEAVRDGVALAKNFLIQNLGTYPGRVEVRVVSDGNVSTSRASECTASPGLIYFDVDHQCWTQKPELRTNQGSVVHEYFHVLQFEMAGGVTLGPTWLAEGSADYIMWRALASNGTINYENRREVLRSQVVAGVTADLEDIESKEAFLGTARSQAVYDLSYVAVDFLASRSGIGSLRTYFEGLRQNTWQESFKLAFGVDIETFYQEFAAYLGRSAPPGK